MYIKYILFSIHYFMYRLESDIVHPDLLPVAYRISERLKLWISAYRSPSYA